MKEKYALDVFAVVLLGCVIIFNFSGICQTSLTRDFLDGKITKYNSLGSGKSSGLKISFNYPSAWKAVEGNRPHIVKKFIDIDDEIGTILYVKKFENAFSKDQIKTELSDQYLITSANENGIYLRHDNKIKIDGLPAATMEYKNYDSKMGINLIMFTVSYVSFYNNYLFYLQFSVSSDNNEMNEKELKEKFEKYKTLFNLIANSIVILNQWE